MTAVQTLLVLVKVAGWMLMAEATVAEATVAEATVAEATVAETQQ